MIVETNKCFGDLSRGDCFFLIDKSNKRLMLKTVNIYTDNENCPFNAVSLNDGVFYSYKDDVEVIPVSARVSF